jgi:hypothetical protein
MCSVFTKAQANRKVAVRNVSTVVGMSTSCPHNQRKDSYAEPRIRLSERLGDGFAAWDSGR